MLTTKFINRVIDISLYAIAGLVVLCFLKIIDVDTLFSVGAFFGCATAAALRELFIAQSKKSRVFMLIGLAISAIYSYGLLTQAEWFDFDRFYLILEVVLGIQVTALFHGAVKSNFKMLAR